MRFLRFSWGSSYSFYSLHFNVILGNIFYLFRRHLNRGPMTSDKIVSRGVNRDARRTPVLRSKTSTRTLRSTTNHERGQEINRPSSRVPTKINITSPLSLSTMYTKHFPLSNNPCLDKTNSSFLHRHSLPRLTQRINTHHAMSTILTISTSNTSNINTRGVTL